MTIARGNVTFCVDYTGNPVRGVTSFKGSKSDERCDWRWIPTTNQDVNDSMVEWSTYCTAESHPPLWVLKQALASEHCPSVAYTGLAEAQITLHSAPSGGLQNWLAAGGHSYEPSLVRLVTHVP
jgi:hypothetical protein